MSFPTRAQLEGLKRSALQAKCKELGIKANSKSEVLIELVLEHYQSTSGPSKPSTSNKRKAQDEGKGRRVRAKVEPEEVAPLQVSPRRKVEVVLRTPAKTARVTRGKGKAKAMTPIDGEIEVGPQPVAVPHAAIAVAQPLTSYPTSATIIDTAVETSTPDDVRMADLELQMRNARKLGDDVSHEVTALKAFQNAIQTAFADETTADTLASMGELAQLRDVAPKLIALAAVDTDALSSRVEAAQKRIDVAAEQLKQDEAEIAELQERLRKLEEKKTSVAELEVMVRQLQSQFNRIPESVFNNNCPEDSATDSRYTIIRPASAAPVAGPSNSQRPSSQLSAPQEGPYPSQNQDQNMGRAISVAKTSRGSRQPLAEKEIGAETDSRRPLQAPSRPTSQSSRGQSVEPYSRSRSSDPSTPNRKGKGRLVLSLDTLNEGESSTHKLSFAILSAPRLPRTNQAASSFFPPPNPAAFTTIGGKNGPTAALPFSLLASHTQPSSQPSSSQTNARSGRTGRVGRNNNRLHQPSVRMPRASTTNEATFQPLVNFVNPPASTASTNGTATSSSATTNGAAASSSATTNNIATSSSATTNGTTTPPTTADGGHGFVTPERLEANFSSFPATHDEDLEHTPGGLAFKTTGRAPPGTPAVTNTMFGTEVARDTRFADLPYGASSGSTPWENSVWPTGNAAKP
ncbi:hypothetical protein RSOLAG22IIIB_02629 [Rhizoctonia solani]|uniref:SAP domain-containing protein n=1 Tax=Rhizoctonia solani TaxID=456999 RepID=A0A0K6GG74_9AGAM|nr:hypothetical protein RSOLAG22IIIB_02629 [Rhizoctonia solani]